MAMMSHSDHSLSPSEASVVHANELYEQVMQLSQDWNNVDDDTARRIIELADDAIKEFGSTNQNKKVELRKRREEAERRLPAGTIEELKKRGLKGLLERVQRNKLLRKILPVLIVLIVIIPLFWYGIEGIKVLRPKTIEQQNGADQPKQINPQETTLPTQGSNIEGLDEAAIAASSSSFSPVSMKEFFDTFFNFSLTDLQRSDFVSRQIGKRVIWEGIIGTVSEFQNEVRVGITDEDASIVYLAIFTFPTDHRSDLLNLKTRQKVKITGILREHRVNIVNLDSSRIIKIWPVEAQTSNRNSN